ncbi:hypothetical protein LC087_03275 [Bacillus carboniphilus]|uniref:Lipoprotein n=1 Tax=Bacillus carboniphilus TaxID=86663 RepID=A0ABY9K010_9BACI|nr:hypothetical protein [Bacillus carboniphilus]WLR43231.1 hypothetical protein LC087_03275 [Bacillus carboniphilus]
MFRLNSLIFLVIFTALITTACGTGQKNDVSEEVAQQDSSTEENENKDSETKEEDQKEETTEPVEDGVVTMERYEKAGYGISYKELVHIMGSKGKMLSNENGVIVYSWPAFESVGGKEVQFTFTNGELTHKEIIK